MFLIVFPSRLFAGFLAYVPLRSDGMDAPVQDLNAKAVAVEITKLDSFL